MTPPERPERPDRPAGSAPSRPARGHATLDRPSGTVVTPDALQVRSRPVLPADGGGGGPLGPLGRRLETAIRAMLARDWAVLGLLLVLAALLRFTGLESRGRFDGDQGHDVLVLLRLVRDGSLPLLGPPTSIGDFHHGAAYYYLLAPVAWLSGASPTAIVAWIAAIGVAAVAATWWFARMVGGPVTAAIAGLLLAVSPAAIEESTFIWNPNPIPLFAALALGCAWRAHESGASRWWVAAVASSGMVVQLHVLGIVFIPPIVALAVSDAIRAGRAGDRARVTAIARAVGAGLGLVVLLFVPLLVHELGSGFEESRHILDYLTGGNTGSPDVDPFGMLTITVLRVIGWPLVGLVTESPVAATVAVSATVAAGAWLAIAGHGTDRTVARWLGLTVAWSGIALTIVAPSLQTVATGLPNDHYHAYLDPVVIVLLALAAKSIAGGSGTPRRTDSAARSVILVALAALVLLDLRLAPPADPNGGWPAARAAGERIVAEAVGRPIDIRGLPVFKTAEGTGFPVIYAGGDAVIATDQATAVAPLKPGAVVVIACDRLFESVILHACGGEAERRFYEGRAPGAPRPPGHVVTFDQSPRISVTMIVP
jgi:hypothetical protein